MGWGIYFWPLTVGGWLQGLAMLDPARGFMDSVILTKPYLQARSVGGSLMTLGHIVFATNFLMMVTHQGPRREGPVTLSQSRWSQKKVLP